MKKLYRNTKGYIYCYVEENETKTLEHVCEINLKENTIKDFNFPMRNDHYVDWFDSIPTTKEYWNKAIEKVMRAKIIS